jgi:hypothetical protein
MNRRGESNLQDEYSDHWGFTWHCLIEKSISCANTIGAVISERKILTPLCLFIQTSSTGFAVASGNGNRLFAGKLHVQITNKLRSPQCQTKAPLLYTSTPLIFRYHLPLTALLEILRKSSKTYCYLHGGLLDELIQLQRQLMPQLLVVKLLWGKQTKN